MTENRENNVSKPEPNSAAGNPDAVSDKLIAGAFGQKFSQEPSPNNDSLSENTRQIIIAAAKPRKRYHFAQMALAMIIVALAGLVFFQLENHKAGTVDSAQVLAQPDQQSHKSLPLANDGSLQ
ncbi:MAG: hypothetical protein ACYSO3_09425, partial [Planctomycetota bacterium]